MLLDRHHRVRQAGAGGWSWSGVREKYCYLAGGWRLELEWCGSSTVRRCSEEKEVSPCGARGIDGWPAPLCAQRQCMLQEKQGAMNAQLIEFN